MRYQWIAEAEMSEITQLLDALNRGQQNAGEQLLELVYDELRKIATARMAGEHDGRTLQPTALVHEAWLRLNPGQDAAFQNRAHFFAAAAEAMRRILIERARRRQALKRGANAVVLDVQGLEIPCPVQEDEAFLELNETLEKFSSLHPRKAELVKLRYFVGMTFEESAAALGIALPTAKQWWAYARAWLRVEMSDRKR
jgi:RNA polymerase sigma factor (TIGR02999 family)